MKLLALFAAALGVAWLIGSAAEKRRRRVFATASRRVILDQCTDEMADRYVRAGWTEYR